MKKIIYKKLIRDRIPQRIKESGVSYSCHVLNRKTFIKELINKVGEEASGLVNYKSRKDIISELGDILDVIDEIKKVFKIKDKEIKDSRKSEWKRKGGFKKRLFLEWAEDSGYKSNERTNK